MKILELTSKDWMSGIAVSAHMPSTGLFTDAAGVNPFVDPLTQSASTGLLQTGATPVDVSGSVMADAVIGSAYNGAAYTAYFSGDGGHIYSLATSGFPNTPTDIRSATVANLAEGLAIWQPNGGTRYLYYWQKTQIGIWNLVGTYPTGWTDNSIAAIHTTGSVIHPVHHLFGNLYYGNVDSVGSISDSGSGSSVSNPIALDIQGDFIVTTLCDDGNFLVVGATTNTIAGNLQIHTLNKIFFWDTNSSTWQREWEIETAFIASIQKIGSTLFALCAEGLYAFNFSTPPTLIVPLSNADGPATVGGVSPTHQIACVKDGVVYWLSSGGDVCAYGSPIPGLAPRFFKPYKAYSTVPSHISVAGKFQFFIAGQSAKFGSLQTSSSGNTSLSAKTIYIPLARKYQIHRLEIYLGEPLVSGDSLNIDVQADEDTTASDWGTVSFTAHGAVRTVMLSGNYTAENLRIVFNFNGGNVKIKKVCVYGDPINV